MAQIIWNDSYSVNNDIIDAQHKEWIAIYNKLDHDLLTGGCGDVATAAADALQAMQDYANYHFREEEQYLRKINYPALVAHKRLHTDFDDQLYGYGRQLRNGELVLSSELLAILKNWLQQHILHEDQNYCAFISQSQS
jgi:hemerythrin-like metal-binding protein